MLLPSLLLLLCKTHSEQLFASLAPEERHHQEPIHFTSEDKVLFAKAGFYNQTKQPTLTLYSSIRKGPFWCTCAQSQSSLQMQQTQGKLPEDNIHSSEAETKVMEELGVGLYVRNDTLLVPSCQDITSECFQKSVG